MLYSCLLTLCQLFVYNSQLFVYFFAFFIGSCFAGSAGCGQPGQDAVVIVNKPQGLCASGSFNANAETSEDCLPCFCFGITDQCSSTELYMSKNDVIIQAVVAVDNNAPIGQKINPGKEVVCLLTENSYFARCGNGNRFFK